ncbi:MAG: response regulator transcription factor [Corynebacterium sp.]|uniref:response regulator transcription factor n=1 Tax=unclassified Corynebacterium TaxID=2624378 RepID=UPI00264A368D|nr:response regulator transcription factor [Corynebacterium sp.]MDN5581545.1 response regulator transcription factor [Corynebacterium sp.]MDN5718677.1 response regulator transcription factor [Corynebacterium sp.]MDN6323799.1 response regulator transcription factor [Corynebacterium sp.]MDN6387449.1 response regulator transcription factor [Corynebacterium sp.]
MIRVLVADDQDLVRGALAALLATERDIDVVAEVGRGDEVVDAVREHRVDVALLDIEMPGMTGIEAAEELQALAASGTSCRSVIVTTFGRPGYLRAALAAGATGFVVKDTPASQLAETVRRVHRGLRVVDPALAEESLFTPDSPLTAREVEVCRAARSGAGVRQIAAQLHLSQGTVRNHLSSVIGKTGTSNRFEAVGVADQNGWL